ncbi:DUF2922 domain-containing protein [Macrococcus armenti]|uniref:DUF2922 domain-containing protein n=1 Tax=Macrococcus armenti TaxID=2875764 RepID=A0ABY3ZRL3_9STAP|nr:DUF2922 domain-containing protein [Macrococcus armenti]UBH16448.1 DUF2922 domain-containing protein [Macrococcus armenti]UBH18804.1 DUF2922 domain-containing protein [Macrococcus armenti]UBH21076.1 DUF2922 domain-containing protein [Macrococcus armenti]UOB19536.1 DUF2922 domain-containing protein [Macrococcus armenti]
MKTLQMNFGTEFGKTYALTITNPKEDITKDEVMQAMEMFISADYLATNSGALTSIKSAKLIDRTERLLFENK